MALFWRPGVRSLPPVRTKRQVSDVPPRSCASRAPTHTRRPFPAEKTSAIHQLDTSANFQPLERPRLPPRPSHRGVNFGRVGVCGIFHTCTRNWAGPAEHVRRADKEGKGHAQPFKARRTACATPRHLRGLMSVNYVTNSRNAKTWLSSAGGGATARAALAQEGDTVCPPGAAKRRKFYARGRSGCAAMALPRDVLS